MDKMPLISVIVPIYNVEKYIHTCINSILNQTYKNLEIILVDDGSPDNCPSICDEYALKDSRIKVIHKPNGGLSSARNAGLDIACGEFICFIDSDDYISCDYCSYLLNTLIKNNADIVECNHIEVNEDAVSSNVFLDTFDEDLQIMSGLSELERLHGIDFPQCLRAVVAWNKLYKASLFNNLRFPVGKLHEDEFTTYKVVFNCERYVISNKVLYAYLQRNTSIMKQTFSIKKLDALEAYDNYINFFVGNNQKYLVMRTCVRYLRLIVRLCSQLYNAEVADKEMYSKLLYNKFNYVLSWLNNFSLSQEDKTIVKNFINEFKDWSNKNEFICS